MEFNTNIFYEIPTITINTPNATIENVGQFKNILVELFSEERKNMIIDMSCVKYIDSTFLGLILHYLKLSQRSGGDLRLVTCEGCGDHPIWVLFETVGVTKVFSIYESIDEALRSFEKK